MSKAQQVLGMMKGLDETQKSVKSANSSDLVQYAKNAGYTDTQFLFSKYIGYDIKKHEHTFAVMVFDENEMNYVVDTMYVTLGRSGTIEGEFGGNGNSYATKPEAIAAANKLK